MSLGRGHLDVLDREGFACARGEGERNEPERNDNGIIMTKYTITRVIGQTRMTYNIEQTEADHIVSLKKDRGREKREDLGGRGGGEEGACNL
jgi:hypothetical protein